MLQQIRSGRSRIATALAFALLTTVGCMHKQDVSSTLRAQMTGFAQMRSQAVAVVRIAKKNLDPSAINQLNVKYAALETDANEYLGFIVESLQVPSFDQTKNQTRSVELSKTIEGFNGSIQPIMNLLKTRPALSSIPLPLQSQWVNDFNSSLSSDWQTYKGQLLAMAPQDRTTLAQQLKADYSWPNFQDIATEKLPLPLASPTAGTH